MKWLGVRRVGGLRFENDDFVGNMFFLLCVFEWEVVKILGWEGII